jgi:hypothetical protein
VLIAAEAVQRICRQFCQAREAVSDLVFHIAIEFISSIDIRLPRCNYAQMVLVWETDWQGPTEGKSHARDGRKKIIVS